ncbi:MAG: DUF3313 domain-containing protein [Comamonadaceae bacterium]|nr:DUF3313 domain-containing protein [Comamonadaceae bacterium]
MMKELSDAFNKELVNALKDKYPIVAEPGSWCCSHQDRTDRDQAEQAGPQWCHHRSYPSGLAVSTVKKGTTGAWTGSGATRAEVMVIDPMNNDEVIAVAS